MSYRKTPEEVGYKPRYKGRRFWILENDPDKSFNGLRFETRDGISNGVVR